MKSKYVAGILSIFFGTLSIHKFYLNKRSIGFIRIILLLLFFYWDINIGIKILFFISLIEGIKLFSMSDENFDSEYNDEKTRFDKQRPWGEKNDLNQTRPKENPYKKTGIEKYKEYDYAGAIENFNKALVIEPFDNATHFNLACAYSVNEDADKAFYHLSKAIEYGYKDTEKLKTHEGLSFIRTMPEYQEWILKYINPTQIYEKESGEELPDLLDQIKILNERRERGELDEDKFLKERKKLLG
ncbi:MAG TPA: NINE protein [Saprospiraceae bacterium]|nr:NINE protein [Saprospiraceae bacterium]